MNLTGIDREAATQMFEDFVESGRLAPQEKITQQIEYFTPQGRSFNRRGAPYKEPQLRVTRKQTYKGKWIPRAPAMRKWFGLNHRVQFDHRAKIPLTGQQTQYSVDE